MIVAETGKRLFAVHHEVRGVEAQAGRTVNFANVSVEMAMAVSVNRVGSGAVLNH